MFFALPGCQSGSKLDALRRSSPAVPSFHAGLPELSVKHFFAESQKSPMMRKLVKSARKHSSEDESAALCWVSDKGECLARRQDHLLALVEIAQSTLAEHLQDASENVTSFGQM